MRECLIVGRPNSGKTMFALNFAGYLGAKNIDLTFRNYEGIITCRHLSIEDAKRELCGYTLHKTRSLQSMILNMKVGKATINFKLTDTCGVSEKIHADEAIRKGMAQTISLLRSVDLILHIVDLSFISQDFSNQSPIDLEFYKYGMVRKSYLLLGNKYDLHSAKANLSRLANTFPKATIIPISALYNQGFREVKACVARSI
ncbi:GTPase [Sporomusa acidovorans]|uniref:G domain-containing protein n=1 Tax=Sporomusa acidovorans (strain ATCC 49682 / DSM 3132 / Mol) TaxID=1123286 RepID=A0ABZ3J2Q7_SPOA4|nr:GTPase [Sporomusa acidovorans]OZC20165.1 tRNA modification GTPase MnmE [Sporomusa acidovorans DSM 3132]SDD43274.1 50S ribosome-binding GTPase [Sporomusa acidovorans]